MNPFATTAVKCSCLHCGQPFGDPERFHFLEWLRTVKDHLRDAHNIYLQAQIPVNVHLILDYI